MSKKPFDPMGTARVNLAEVAAGKIIPTAPIAYGLIAGTPFSLLILKALEESGVHLGPYTASLVGLAVSALTGYITRGGRRQSRSNKT